MVTPVSECKKTLWTIRFMTEARHRPNGGIASVPALSYHADVMLLVLRILQ
jgi:hypothetical protein